MNQNVERTTSSIDVVREGAEWAVARTVARSSGSSGDLLKARCSVNGRSVRCRSGVERTHRTRLFGTRVSAVTKVPRSPSFTTFCTPLDRASEDPSTRRLASLAAPARGVYSDNLL